MFRGRGGDNTAASVIIWKTSVGLQELRPDCMATSRGGSGTGGTGGAVSRAGALHSQKTQTVAGGCPAGAQASGARRGQGHAVARA